MLHIHAHTDTSVCVKTGDLALPLVVTYIPRVLASSCGGIKPWRCVLARHGGCWRAWHWRLAHVTTCMLRWGVTSTRGRVDSHLRRRVQLLGWGVHLGVKLLHVGGMLWRTVVGVVSRVVWGGVNSWVNICLLRPHSSQSTRHCTSRCCLTLFTTFVLLVAELLAPWWSSAKFTTLTLKKRRTLSYTITMKIFIQTYQLQQ